MQIIKYLSDKYSESKQRSLNKSEFKQLALDSVNAGKFTKDVEKLEKKKKQLGIRDSDLRDMDYEVYNAAFELAKQDKQMTKKEEDELNLIQKYFGMSDLQIQSKKEEIERLKMLSQIQNGKIPPLATIPGLILQKAEIAYWSEPSSLVEQKVVSRKYQGGYSGASFRVMKGVSIHAGGSHGHIVSQKGNVIVSRGNLIITNKRIIFTGDTKSFSAKFENLLDLQVFSNAIHFSEDNRTNPRLLKFENEGNKDVLGSILSYSINHYSK